jgi:hypothetical protein
MIKIYCLVVIGCLTGFAQTASAQTERFVDKLQFRTFAGARLDYPLGATFGGLRMDRKQANDALGDNYELSSLVLPRTAPLLGIQVGMPVSARLQGGMGVQFSQRGYVLQLKHTFEDPTYQYDEVGKQKVSFRLNTIECPVWLAFSLKKSWWLETGFVAGFNQKASAKGVYQAEETVTINGSVDKEWSRSKQKEEVTLSEATTGFSPGFYGAVHRLLWRDVGIRLAAQYTGSYLNLNESKVSGLSMSLAVQYNIPSLWRKKADQTQ